eukprot:10842425-Ditylum_brightwellii.AAC.1
MAYHTCSFESDYCCFLPNIKFGECGYDSFGLSKIHYVEFDYLDKPGSLPKALGCCEIWSAYFDVQICSLNGKDCNTGYEPSCVFGNSSCTQDKDVVLYEYILNDWEEHVAINHVFMEGQLEFETILICPKCVPFDMFEGESKKSAQFMRPALDMFIDEHKLFCFMEAYKGKYTHLLYYHTGDP